MAIYLMFYNIIIPIKNIEKCKNIGGFKGILDYHKKKGNMGKIWYDNYLYRDGSMSPMDNGYIINFWKKQGLNPIKKINDKKYWDELCLVNFCSGPTLPCEWIEFKIENDFSNPHVWLKGFEEGKVVKGNW